MISPALDRLKNPHIWKRLLDGFGHRCHDRGIPGAGRKPLLQNPIGTQVLSRNSVELLRVEQAGSGRFDGWWRIQNDDIVLFSRSFKVKPSVVDNDVRTGRTHQLFGIGMKEREYGNYARHKLHRRRRNSPGKHGAMSRSHPKANHEGILRWSLHES